MNTPRHNCRLRLPERNQVEIHFLALEQLLSDDHQARLVWAYVEGLDLAPLYQAIQARQGVAGRDANAPVSSWPCGCTLLSTASAALDDSTSCASKASPTNGWQAACP